MKGPFILSSPPCFSVAPASARCRTGNCTDGKGIMLYEDGRRYEGEWAKGLEGQGTCVFPDGSRYEGLWKGGVMHGRGPSIS